MQKRNLFIILTIIFAFGASACEPTPPAPTDEVSSPTPTLAPPTPTLAPTVTPAGPSLGDTWTRPIDGAAMVYVPGGTFPMGSDEDDVEDALELCDEYLDDCERSWFEREQPVHEVTLDGFWIDRYEVTNAQYARCVADGDCDESPYADNPTYNGDDYPVVGVTWYYAKDYCAWAGGRLPTEAEWEYAARGPEGRIYPWGSEFDCSRCNIDDGQGGCDGYAETAPVGSFPGGVSWCGARDLAGNVWEWVADWYDEDYYADSPAANPTGPSSGEYRVLRGGSWANIPSYVHCADRFAFTPDLAYYYFGFRCVRDS